MKTHWLVAVLALASPALAAETSAPSQPSAPKAHGVDFAQVDFHRESRDGQVVLAITGMIVNNGTRELPVPQTIIVTISDANNHELYHWPFAPGVRTLKPKQSQPFATRLSSPPAAARHLEVRFARNG